MDSKLRQLERDLQIDPTLIFDYWTACKRAGIVTVYSLITAIREIETILHREFADLYWPAKERRHGLINSMDFRTPESTTRSIEKWIYKNVNFHLSPCVCGAPGWPAPCLFCGYENYMGDIRKSERNLTKDDFIKALHDRRYQATSPPAFDPSRPYGLPSYIRPDIVWNSYPLDGNIAKLWASEKFFSYYLVAEWKPRAWTIGQRAIELVNALTWPSAAEVWDVYSRRPCEVAGCSYSAQNVVSIPTWKFPDLPFDTEVPHLSNRCSRHQEQPFSRNPPFRRNPDEELRNLAREYQLDPSLEHREMLFRKMFSRLGASGLGVIFEDYERPLLAAFAATPTSTSHPHLEANFFERYSFEKVYDFGDGNWKVASLDEATEVEARWEAHLLTEITKETPASQGYQQYPARRFNLALLRSPTHYYIREINTDLNRGTLYIDYYSRPATDPLFEGWSRFEKYEGAHDTWDYVIETGMGSPTKEEEQAILKLGYYGQKINKKTINGLIEGEPFKTIAPGKYCLTIHAIDGNHQKWFETREEALNAARKDPGTPVSRTSWVNNIGSTLEVEDIASGEFIRYVEIFNPPPGIFN
jgi:hypothetical protein